MKQLTLVLIAIVFGGGSFLTNAAAETPARSQTFVRNIDRELTRNPLFHALEGLAERHGFEMYIEKESADSLLRLVGTDWLQTAHTRPNLDFLGANENMQLVVRGSQYHLDLVRTLIGKHFPHVNAFTKKSRWETRLETTEEKNIEAQFSWMVPRIFIACRNCGERVDARFVNFFLDNEAEMRSTQNSVELLTDLRKLEKIVQKRPTNIKAEVFHSTLVAITQISAARISVKELPAIFEVMNSIDSETNRFPLKDNAVLINELRTMGFFEKYQDVTKRMLAIPAYGYEFDFNEIPDAMKKQAGTVTDYFRWTAARSCQAMFESVH